MPSSIRALVLASVLGCSGSPASHPDAAPIDGPAADAAATDTASDAISAPDDQWTWIDFPESKCASGTPTGMGINPHAGATDLIVYFKGGGGCTTGATCWGPMPQATFLDGYGAAEFASYGPPDFPILDRGNAANPLRNANMMFVPYCTGDMHVGTKEIELQVDGTTKPTYFWGGTDLDLFLARVVPTFTNTQHVWIIGASAGGFASFLTYDKIANAFPGARVDILDDSGPPILAYHATQNANLAYWGFQPPATCTAPCDSYAAVVAADRARQPNSKIGYLLFEHDSTLWSLFHFPTIDDYGSAIDAFVSSLSDPDQHYLLVTNAQDHVVESDHAIDAVTLPWIAQMVTDDPAWQSTTYAHP
jgi:hypothetical protein